MWLGWGVATALLGNGADRPQVYRTPTEDPHRVRCALRGGFQGPKRPQHSLRLDLSRPPHPSALVSARQGGGDVINPFLLRVGVAWAPALKGTSALTGQLLEVEGFWWKESLSASSLRSRVDCCTPHPTPDDRTSHAGGGAKGGYSGFSLEAPRRSGGAGVGGHHSPPETFRAFLWQSGKSPLWATTKP